MFDTWYVFEAVLWLVGGSCLVVFRKKVARCMHVSYTKSWSFMQDRWYSKAFRRSEGFFVMMVTLSGVLIAYMGLGRFCLLLLRFWMK